MNVYDNGWVIGLIGLHLLYMFTDKVQLQARCKELEKENIALKQRRDDSDGSISYFMTTMETACLQQQQDRDELERLQGLKLDSFDHKDCSMLEKDLLSVLTKVRDRKVSIVVIACDSTNDLIHSLFIFLNQSNIRGALQNCVNDSALGDAQPQNASSNTRDRISRPPFECSPQRMCWM